MPRASRAAVAELHDLIAPRFSDARAEQECWWVVPESHITTGDGWAFTNYPFRKNLTLRGNNMAKLDGRFETEKSWVKWTTYDYLRLTLIQTAWGKAVIGAAVSFVSTVASYLVPSPLLIAGSIGGFIVSLGIFLWAWLQSRKESRLKPLIPDALHAIDQRIDIVWDQHFGTAKWGDDIMRPIEAFREDLKTRLRLMLTALDMVKTREEYALEEIAKITNDKDHPYHHPEDPFHEMALRRMIELKQAAYIKNGDSD